MQAAWDNFPPDVGSTHGAQLTAMVTDMDAGTTPLTSGAEARRTIEFLTALYKSAYTGTTVTRGSIRPGDPFYEVMHGGLAPKRTKG
jgi:predicted dehydrogenase